MTRALLNNNALTTLSAAMAIGDTTFQVVAAAGFPGVTTASGNYFYCTLVDGAGIPEIVKVTNITGNIFSCTRAQDNTATRTFASGAAVSLRLTAAVLAELQDMASKDASGGYAGLTGFAINIWNAAKTFKSLLSFAGTANRSHELPDKNGTVALTSDITGGTSAGSFATLSTTGFINGGYTLTAELSAINDASDKPSTLFFANPNSAAGSGAGISFVRTWLNSYDVVIKVSGGGAATNSVRFSPSGMSVIGGISATGALSTAGLKEDSDGNLLAGVASGTSHMLIKASAADAGNSVLMVAGPSNVSSLVYSVSGYTPNAANAALKIGHDSLTGRGLASGGSILGGGADHAEYERNNGLTIAKGQVIGFQADGTLTLTYLDAAHFGIKSTNPSFVGGDTWGSEEIVGKRPDEPQFTPAVYTGSEAPTEPTAPAPLAADATQEQIDAHAAAVCTYEAAKPIYDAALYTYTMDIAQYAASVGVAKSLFDTATYPEYLRAKAVFEASLEVERLKVDRIAYSGKVPCNIMGAVPGGYIIAVADAAGAITGEFVADPDFVQYKRAVGRVNKIIDEAAAKRLAKQINMADWKKFVGYCEVAVIIH